MCSSDLIVPGGLIAVDAVRNGEVGEPLACLAMSSLFAGEANATVQRAARGCLEAAVAANPRLAPAFTLLGELYLREWRHGLDPLPGDPLARADAALRRAVLLAPQSATARQSLAEVAFLRGDADAAAAFGREAVALKIGRAHV